MITASTTHGMFGTPTYNSWAHMLQRCGNPKNHKYPDYGGRGIKVCPEWVSFEGFYKSMGLKPEGLSLERKDVNGNYEPSNCKWATASEQNRNKRNVPMIVYNGKAQCLRAWSEDTGIDYRKIHKRISKFGWSVERALTTP